MNNIHIDFSDPASLRAAMDKYHTTATMLPGVNTNGEHTTVSIFADRIVLVTYQNNGWVRKNFFDENGYPAGEMFDGKWES